MANKMLTIPSWHPDLSTLLVRLLFGGLFMYHGYTKLAAFDQILPMFTDIIGIGPKLSFILVIIAELGCGFLVAIGFITRLAVIPIFFTMLIAFFIAHAKDPFIMKELAFLFLVLCIPIFLSGSGRYSVDHVVLKK